MRKHKHVWEWLPEVEPYFDEEDRFIVTYPQANCACGTSMGYTNSHEPFVEILARIRRADAERYEIGRAQ